MSGASKQDPSAHYVLENKLGTGSFGSVYKALHIPTRKYYAIKIIDLEHSDDDVTDIQLEVAHLSESDSPFITKHYGSFLKGWKLWIVMEYLAGGSCLQMLKAGTLPEHEIAVICKQVLLGLDYLHAEGRIHRDIKAANILLSAEGDVKLADLGVAARLTSTLAQRNTFVGTPFWMAPEVIQQSGYGIAADIWSLGITAIELAVGRPPLSEHHPMRVLFLIPKARPPSLEGDFSGAFKEFVDLCLTKDPSKRPSVKELLEHRFVKFARRPAILRETLARHRQWRELHGGEAQASDPTYRTAVDTLSSAGWDFERSRILASEDEEPERAESAFETVRRNEPLPRIVALDEDQRRHLKTYSDVLLPCFAGLEGSAATLSSQNLLDNLVSTLRALSEEDPALASVVGSRLQDALIPMNATRSTTSTPSMAPLSESDDEDEDDTVAAPGSNATHTSSLGELLYGRWIQGLREQFGGLW